MKTTIDLPDEILHRAKVVAAQNRTSLKALVLAGLDHVLNSVRAEPEAQAEALRRLRKGLRLGGKPLTRIIFMNAIRFLDTNILLYAYDEDAPAKRAVALRLVEQGWSQLGQTAISVQVLQEMHVNFQRFGVPQFEAAQIVRDFAAWPIVDNSLDLLLAALNEHARWRLSLWDALILSAARASGAREVFTEDFSHGQDYGGIRAINPFLQMI